MKQFQLDNIKYNVPTSWNEVTVKQQMAVSQAANDIKVDELKKMAIISGYCTIPMDVMRKTAMHKLNKLWKHLEFINEPLPEDAISEFEYKGEKYTVVESLIKNEFQDYVSLATVQDMHKDDLWNALPYMIAILAKKPDESLDDFDVEERAKHFEELPITIANRIKVFFYAINSTSQLSSLWYSNRNQIVQQRVEESTTTINKLVGKGWRFRLLVGALRKYLRFIVRVWEKFSNSLPTKP